MVYCPYCGEENRDDARFCRKCGNTLPEIEKRPIEHPREPTYPIEEKVEGFEWNVAIVAAFMLLISFGILRMMLPQIAPWLAAAFSLLYLLSAAKKKVSIPFLVIITLIIAMSISAFIGL